MIEHHTYIQAINSKTHKTLTLIANQWEEFLKTLQAMTPKEQTEILRNLLQQNQLIEPFSLKLPLFNMPSQDMTAILLADLPTANIYLFIITQLEKLKKLKAYLYPYRQNQNPTMVLVWKQDVPLISKYLKKKLIQITVTENGI